MWRWIHAARLHRTERREKKGKERVEAAATQRKLALASVSGVAGPWVSWAILKEGRRRSGAPLVHKPLCKIPHFVSQPPHGTVGERVTNDKCQGGRD